MFKLFSITEATRLLPVIEGHVATLQGASHDAEALKRRLAEIGQQRSTGRTAGGVESQNLLQELSFLAGCAHAAKTELDRLGVELTDLEGGAVAIPASVAGEVVALTWARGQDEITHYRRLTGDADPHPLPSDVLIQQA